jgi:hypothetical protein
MFFLFLNINQNYILTFLTLNRNQIQPQNQLKIK